MWSINLWNYPIEDQKRSGRCWIYASLNPFRQKTRERFSTNYVYYFDQLGKSAAFIDQIIRLRDRPIEDAELSGLLRIPCSNVGQWCYFAAIVEKQGLVPLAAMPDTDATADGARLTAELNTRLRYGAWELREGNAEPNSILQDIRLILQKHLGAPPEQFLYGGKAYTPLDFYHCCGIDLKDYVMLIHHPSALRPANCAYNEAKDKEQINPLLTMLSLDINDIKKLVLRQLQEGEQVVIACDVRHCGSRKDGILDLALDVNRPRLTKAQAIAYREVNACHVMSIDGWSSNGLWKVQDSHGMETGTDGHYMMTDEWFDQFVLSAVVRKEYLTPPQRQALDFPEYMPKTERF